MIFIALRTRRCAYISKSSLNYTEIVYGIIHLKSQFPLLALSNVVSYDSVCHQITNQRIPFFAGGEPRSPSSLVPSKHWLSVP